ncbi:MAG: hypothetical protein AB8F94_18190, partial [Saprospiraceae bacterium]
MKKLILDAPFRDTFADYLVKGETIVWEGQPSLKSSSNFDSNSDDSNDYSRFAIITTFIIGFIILCLIKGTPYISWFFYLVLIFNIIIIPIWLMNKKKSYHYAITQNQILFQFKKDWKNKKAFQTIPLSEIKDIMVVMTYDIERIKTDYKNANEAIPSFYLKTDLEKIGTIFIIPKDPKSINFETTDLLQNEKRHLPTLELLEDANAVAEIIR